MQNSPPTSHKIAEFHKWKTEERLDFTPPFQRKPVWGPSAKSYLIDTVLTGNPIPEIYLQIATDISGNTKYVVVDGQQRIRAILEFIDKEFKIEEEGSRFNGKEFTQLPDGVKIDFWNYGLVVRELETSKDSEVREVFRRLNKNAVALNPQEMRNGTYSGKFIQLVNKLADEDYWADNRIVSAVQIRRMIDAEFISELLVGMLHGPQKKDKEALDRYYQDYESNFDDSEVRRKFEQTKNKVDQILEDIRTTRWHNQAEYYALFLAIHQLSEEYFFPQQRFPKIEEVLVKFSTTIDKAVRLTQEDRQKAVIESSIAKYLGTVEKQTTDLAKRKARIEVVRSLIIPFLIAKDSTRSFSEEERRIAWDNVKDRKCVICGKQIKSWDDFELDHKVPYTKGGKTELENGQISHRSCNRKKSSK